MSNQEGEFGGHDPAQAELEGLVEVGSSGEFEPSDNLIEHDEVMRVVYQSDQHGALVGVESATLLRGGGGSASLAGVREEMGGPSAAELEEEAAYCTASQADEFAHELREPRPSAGEQAAALPIYSEVDKRPLLAGQPIESSSTSFYSNVYQQELEAQPASENEQQLAESGGGGGGGELGDQEDEAAKINAEIQQLIARQRGAVEKGSFRHNFRKKLGLSASTNENELTTYRQRLLDGSGEPARLSGLQALDSPAAASRPEGASAPASECASAESASKFKRTHSVSFSVHATRGNRLSVDIRNLPSYLTHKRASIVDVARGAMSSLMSSLGGGGGERRDSSHASGAENEAAAAADQEPIFEEPIAPTLSLGQRVALVRAAGSEFGTVGWIGQLDEVEDDWVVGVIFDNMIGNCDGELNGSRYFYARPNYAMFVPLSALTKTDNYIGRPETGTMLSRMSVSLKAGQLISIQRSSIRLQHCFLNAPHQRVGHDVRAVSNRLHCQCHNCGPCAHLTKQGRVAALPHFGAHHLPHRKKNSLAHAAVELLAHHHHHFHEEEEETHEEKDYQFGDNAAHACNFVRYSCCQQRGAPGHEFSTDCRMVRPELLDNLIHAPKAPHRRSRPRRARTQPSAPGSQALQSSELGKQKQLALGPARRASLDKALEQDKKPRERAASAPSSSRSGSESGTDSRSCSPEATPGQQHAAYNYYTYDSTTTSCYRPCSACSTSANGAGALYNTIDSHISIMDQRRFIYQRDSGAFVHHQHHHQQQQQQHLSSSHCDHQQHYYADSSNESCQSSSLGRRLMMRCFGCLRRRARRSSSSRRKLSARDKLLEYRRRQSTFVPSTLAKPQEDFASHGIILANSARAPSYAPNSDYSSCSASNQSSRSSSSSSRSSSPRNSTLGARGGPIEQQMFAQQFQAANQDYALKCEAQQLDPMQQENRIDNWPAESSINYTDYSFSDTCELYKKHEQSRDSALADLAYSSEDSNLKTDHSCETLKQLVDQSINELVPQPPETLATDTLISPLSSAPADAANECCHCDCDLMSDHTGCSGPASEQVEISSPTASTASAVAQSNHGEELDDACRAIEYLSMEQHNKHHQGAARDSDEDGQ